MLFLSGKKAETSPSTKKLKFGGDVSFDASWYDSHPFFHKFSFVRE